MTERKLATIRRVDQILPIEGADRIVLARIGGWQVITQKTNFKEGDLCLFFEVDSFLPVHPEYEWLRKTNFKSTTNLGDGFRLRTMKMRGHVSQGLALPLKFENGGWKLESTAYTGHVFQDEDVTERLQVKLYEKPVPVQMQGRATNFPTFLWRTDQERVQNLTARLPEYMDEMFEITQKLDGTSMTVYKKGSSFGVCSRNWELEAPNLGEELNAYFRIAAEARLFDMLRFLDCDCAIQGELCGPGIQGNPEGLVKAQFFMFDAFDITEQRRLLPGERLRMVNTIRNADAGFELLHCPVLSYRTLSSIESDPTKLLDALLTMADGPNLSGTANREGVVFKAVNQAFTFKVISNAYLLAEKE